MSAVAGRHLVLLALWWCVFAVASATEPQANTAICVLAASSTLTLTAVTPLENATVTYSICSLTPSASTYVLEFLKQSETSANSTLNPVLLNRPIATTDANGCSSGTLDLSGVALNGQTATNLIGRAVRVRGTSLACVIGRDVDDGSAVAPDRLATAAAVCELTSTQLANQAVSGYVEFFPRASGTGIDAYYVVTGLGLMDSTHNVQIHTKGNVGDTAAGSATGDVFVGDVTGSGRAAIGALPTTVQNRKNVARGYFKDAYATLSGTNNIVGRSLVLFDANTPTNRIAQCVIGVRAEGAGLPAPASDPAGTAPQTTSAIAFMRAVEPSPILEPAETPIDGSFRFDYDKETLQVRVRYFLVGLPPGPHSFHVHKFGDLCDADGSSVGGHYEGTCNMCRPSGLHQEIGLLDNGTALVADENGIARGEFLDTAIEFAGTNSILGRAIIIHGNGTSGNGAYIAVGVIGRAREDPTKTQQSIGTPITVASCSFEPTTVSDDSPTPRGYVLFQKDPTDGHVTVEYNIHDLPPGSHTWHIHELGNLGDVSGGLGTLGHFIGTPPPGRPSSTLNEIATIGNGAALTPDAAGVALGVFKDKYLNFTGLYGFVGRSMIIHWNGTATRIAQCVIGRQEAGSCAAQLPQDSFVRSVKEAICHPRSTSVAGGATIGGFVKFEAQPNGTTLVSYQVTGLDDGVLHGMHVHTLGDIFMPDGSSPLGHYGGCSNCRPGTAEPNNIGYLGDGVLLNATGGVAQGSFLDAVVKLNGATAVVGRSVVIHGKNGDAGAKVAQCVIGKNDAPSVEALQPKVVMDALTPRASCVLRPTSKNAVSTGAGYVTFDAVDPTKPLTTAVNVHFYVHGIQAGEHKIRIHQQGNVGDETAALDVGVAIRNFSGETVRDTSDGVAIGQFVAPDNVKLNGINSIVGRTLTIESSTNTELQFQCVVGIRTEGTPTVPVNVTDGDSPYVTRVIAVLEAASASVQTMRGLVEMDFDASTNTTTTTFMFSGLDTSPQYTLYVRENGNLCNNASSTSTSTTGSIYAGLDEDGNICGQAGADCRPADSRQRIGELLLTPVTQFVTASNGEARGTVKGDAAIQFNSTNSILGRSIVVYDTTNSRIALQGVLGRAVERYDVVGESPRPRIFHAAARLQPTLLATSQIVDGFVSFTESVSGHTHVRYKMWGLSPPGVYTWHVHVSGDVTSIKNGKSVGNHFVGEPDPTRPVTALNADNEVGQLGDGYPVVVDENGVAYGDFVDHTLTLHGWNGVVGRSLIVHAPSGARVAMGVIGVESTEGANAFPECPLLPNNIRFASAVLEPTGRSTLGLEPWGTVEFTRFSTSSQDVRIAWTVCGLTPGQAYLVAIHRLGVLWPALEPLDPATGGVFKGCPKDSACSSFQGCGANCRPNHQIPSWRSRVGALVDRASGGSQLNFTTDARGCAIGSTIDDYVRLRSVNSIVGRSFVVYSDTSGYGDVIAHGVVSRHDAETISNNPGGNYPDVLSAACKFRKTALVLETGSEALTGWATIEDTTTDPSDVNNNGKSQFNVRYFLAGGMPKGSYYPQIHTYGDLRDARGAGLHDVFVGPNCKTVACRETFSGVGYLDDRLSIVQATRGVASGAFVDAVLTLNDDDSIVGRGLALTALDDSELRAMCVMGIAREWPIDYPPTTSLPFPQPEGALTMGIEMIYRGACYLEPTPGSAVTGYVNMEILPGTRTMGISYLVSGLTNGTDHTWQIETLGELCRRDGTSGAGVFDGSCNNDCRPGGDGQAIGYMNGTKALRNQRGTVAQGYFEDKLLSFNGTNSIVGRAITVRRASDSAVLAQCTIGRVNSSLFTYGLDTNEYFQASAVLQPTYYLSPISAATRLDIRGYVHMSRNNDSGELEVEYQVHNLSPGEHQWGIHVFGDLLSVDNANATGKAFTQQQFAGLPAMKADERGHASGKFKSGVLQLHTKTSIIGRAVVVFGTASYPDVRVAQGVIGISSTLDGSFDGYCIYDPSSSSQTLAIALGTTFGFLGLVIIGLLLYFCVIKKRGGAGAGAGASLKSDPDLEMTYQREPEAYTSPVAAAFHPTNAAEAAPAPWQIYHDDDGNAYYYNPITQMSQWEKPLA